MAQRQEGLSQERWPPSSSGCPGDRLQRECRHASDPLEVYVCTGELSGYCAHLPALYPHGRQAITTKLRSFENKVSPIFFWDKVERCYYFLQACVETAQRKEPVDGRLVQFLLSNPTNDGGQWDMLVNLIEKYGVIPKKCFPESHSSEASRRMNDILNHKLREYCLRLRNMVASDATKAELSDAMDTMIEEVMLSTLSYVAAVIVPWSSSHQPHTHTPMTGTRGQRLCFHLLYVGCA
ncbi:bleomycin hydrolase [Lates japonicus]|uniref:Bleomycin hydrolase n=1 Tax=Lates japonicus TaxID=270547 RepID=A0AAD3MWZ7_LATJO|nr:bleomycin hydrolase [Lates japonicus]